MEGDLILHVIHISGVRMIHCGIDGLSRSDYNEESLQERAWSLIWT